MPAPALAPLLMAGVNKVAPAMAGGSFLSGLFGGKGEGLQSLMGLLGQRGASNQVNNMMIPGINPAPIAAPNPGNYGQKQPFLGGLSRGY